MLLRIRSNVGVWRVDNLDDETATVNDVLEGIKVNRPNVEYLSPLSFDPGCKEPLDATKPLGAQQLRHGSMVHCRVEASTCVEVKQSVDASEQPKDAAAALHSTANMKRIIDKDGAIKLVPMNEANAPSDKGFRKGMLPLRDMKMAWTLNEFVAMDSQFEFKIQRQESAICSKVSLDSSAIGDFQAYCARFAFQRKRFGIMYGRFVEVEDDKKDGDKDGDTKMSDNADGDDAPPTKTKAVVEAIYEPPQEIDSDAAEGFVQLEDPQEETIDQLASMLGLRKVGWVFGHAPRENGFVMNAAEIIMAAEMQLEAAEGVAKTPFVTVKVTTGKDGNTSVEAFQVSQQCMAMVAEEALEIDENPGFCKVNETFTAIQEGKPSPTVENNFFLTVVPIVSHTSQLFVSQFPKANRDALSSDDRKPSQQELKKQLSKAGSAGWTFTDLLGDFHLLLFLTQSLDLNGDLPKVCESIVDRDVPLDDGYKILIKSIAGLDGSY